MIASMTWSALAAVPAAVALPLAGVLGAWIGSFLTVVVWRVPRGLSMAGPWYACTACGRVPDRRQRIPLLSALLRGATCPRCGVRLARRSPLIEAATAVAFVLVTGGAYALWYPAALLPVLLYWAAIGIALTLIDLDVHRLPNAIVLPSYPVTAGLLVFASIVADEGGRLLTAAIGGAVLFALYGVLAVASPGGMG